MAQGVQVAHPQPDRLVPPGPEPAPHQDQRLIPAGGLQGRTAAARVGYGGDEAGDLVPVEHVVEGLADLLLRGQDDVDQRLSCATRSSISQGRMSHSRPLVLAPDPVTRAPPRASQG